MKRLSAVITKEFFHILRDPRSLTIVFIMPVFMLLIYSHAISFDLNRINTGIVDFSKSHLSSQLINRFSNNHYFSVRPFQDLAQAEKELRAGKIKEYLIVPGDFSTRLKSNQKTALGIVIDGSDSNVANLVYQYNEMVLLDFMLELKNVEHLFQVHTKLYFNPEAKSAFFFVPGLFAVLLLMVSAMLTSLSMTKEKEIGSIQLLFISPLKSGEIIIGKTIPYILIAMLEGVLILLVAQIWFGIPIRGSLWEILFFSLLYILTGLSFGILISTSAPNQKIAMIATLLITLLPSFLLSGFIFPLDSLSPILRAISYIVPATYFLRIIRGLVLKGSELKHFLWEGTILLIFSLGWLILAAKRFTRQRKMSA